MPDRQNEKETTVVDVKLTPARLAVLRAVAAGIRDAEGGTWRQMDDSDYFMPEFAGGNMTLTEIIDHFGPVTALDTGEGE